MPKFYEGGTTDLRKILLDFFPNRLLPLPYLVCNQFSGQSDNF